MKLTIATFALVLLHTATYGRSYSYNKEWFSMSVQDNKIILEDAFGDPRTIFTGSVNMRTNAITGRAFIRTKRCGDLPFSVTGKFKERWIELSLTGEAPIIDEKTCRVWGARKKTLVFKASLAPAVE
jgi:hypothetical protein